MKTSLAPSASCESCELMLGKSNPPKESKRNSHICTVIYTYTITQCTPHENIERSSRSWSLRPLLKGAKKATCCLLQAPRAVQKLIMSASRSCLRSSCKLQLQTPKHQCNIHQFALLKQEDCLQPPPSLVTGTQSSIVRKQIWLNFDLLPS